MSGRVVQKVGDLVSLGDWSREWVLEVLDLAAQMKSSPGAHARQLAGRSIVLLFEKASLRTRMALEVGIARLGGHCVYFDHSAQRIGERESIRDYARNLDRWVDAIVARTYSHETVEALGEHASVPVINALTDREHPCQALADLLTLREHLGRLEGTVLAYLGEGNNVCHALAFGCAHAGVALRIVTPEGFGPDAGVIARARALGGEIEVGTDVGLVEGVDAVYTDTWASMGSGSSSSAREAVFGAYRVDEALMARAGEGALFMHCLPAARGYEVTEGVIDSDRSVVYDQAENRMHTHNAVLGLLLG